ncbi:hypothetical protein AK830_g6276 [Neonectria ditissima]|uniref:Uncharacterized protein n=1 Tax=Neonectria ditissima TaxID=78410 RepID=A0A0P7BJR3_9HYPO|nr:hypothetical protein AK830_g6276 [Neonectria ditissima]
MKHNILIAFILATGSSVVVAMHDSKTPVLNPASCFPGMVYCRNPPYNYRCDTMAQILKDRTRSECEDSCSCRYMASRVEGSNLAKTVESRPQPGRKPCGASCAWGYGWCQTRPYSYRCDERGRLLKDSGHSGCDQACWCGCTETSPVPSFNVMGKMEL